MFGTNDDGFFYDPADLTAQYDWTGSTVPQRVAASDGVNFTPITISRIQDLGPRNRSSYTSVEVWAPRLRAVSKHNTPLYFWEFDGINDVMFQETTALSAGKYDIICCVALIPEHYENGYFQISGYRGIFSHIGDTCSLFTRGGGPTYGTWGPGWYGADSRLPFDDIPRPQIISMVGGASGSFRHNGVQDGTYAHTTGQASPLHRAFIGGLTAHGQNCAMRLYGILAINRRLTDSEIISVETYFADRAGVTLNT